MVRQRPNPRVQHRGCVDQLGLHRTLPYVAPDTPDLCLPGLSEAFTDL